MAATSDAECLVNCCDLLLATMDLAIGSDTSAIGELGTNCQHTTSCLAVKQPCYFSMQLKANTSSAFLQAQIAAKEQRAAAETDQQWEEAQANAAAEAAYQAKVNETLSSAAPKQYFGRRKVEWFT